MPTGHHDETVIRLMEFSEPELCHFFFLKCLSASVGLSTVLHLPHNGEIQAYTSLVVSSHHFCLRPDVLVAGFRCLFLSLLHFSKPSLQWWFIFVNWAIVRGNSDRWKLNKCRPLSAKEKPIVQDNPPSTPHWPVGAESVLWAHKWFLRTQTVYDISVYLTLYIGKQCVYNSASLLIEWEQSQWPKKHSRGWEEPNLSVKMSKNLQFPGDSETECWNDPKGQFIDDYQTALIRE